MQNAVILFVKFLVQSFLNKGLQMLLKDTAELNHVLFLFYLSTFHNAVLLFMQAGPVLTEKKDHKGL